MIPTQNTWVRGVGVNSYDLPVLYYGTTDQELSIVDRE